MSKLVRLESMNNNLRTNEIEGTYPQPPKVGQSFMFLAQPIDPKADIRVITTSTVQSVEHFPDGKIRFNTLNSMYELY